MTASADTIRGPEGGPFNELTKPYYGCNNNPGPHAMWVYDFTEYRYLPHSAANRKSTNIRAMHPNSKIV